MRSGPGAKLVCSRASVEGVRIAAPAPCSARAAISQASDCATPTSEGGGGEQRDAGDEHPAASEQVAGAGAEQQQAAEGEQVGVLHP